MNEADTKTRPIALHHVLVTLLNQLDIEFYVDGERTALVELFSPKALLPVVALHGQLKARELLGIDLGVRLERCDQSLLRTSCSIPDLVGDDMSIMRACFVYQATRKIFGLSTGAHIEVAPVIERYAHGLCSDPGDVAEPAMWPLAHKLNG